MFFTRFAVCVFLSTPSSRRATHSCKTTEHKQSISIHALLAEGDSTRAT